MTLEMSIPDIEQEVERVRVEVSSQVRDPKNVEAIVSIVTAGNLLSTNGRNMHHSSVAPIDVTETFAEWASRYDIVSHTDRFLAVAVYLYNKGEQDISTNRIMEMYSKARWMKPKNPADVIGKAANNKLFTESDVQPEDGPRNWRITRTGFENFQGLHSQGQGK